MRNIAFINAVAVVVLFWFMLGVSMMDGEQNSKGWGDGGMPFFNMYLVAYATWVGTVVWAMLFQHHRASSSQTVFWMRTGMFVPITGAFVYLSSVVIDKFESPRYPLSTLDICLHFSPFAGGLIVLILVAAYCLKKQPSPGHGV